MDGNSKRIIKNSFLLYIRFFIILIVGLYTSRIVLKNLGVEDYGIYNVIAGVITIFSLLRLTYASQRFISYELGKKDIKQVFLIVRNFNFLNLIICIITLVVAETVGLLFFRDVLSIPTERIPAAFIVYQCTIISFLSLVFSTTYNSCIISYEYMSAFAYISIAEVMGKLLIAYLLVVDENVDKLVLYSILMTILQITINLTYIGYCRHKIKGIPIGFGKNNGILKEIVSFSLWLNFSGVFIWLSNQGQNVLLNIFVGPIANAARGVSMQVQGAVSGFCSNIFQAVAPQITKTYASSNWIYLQDLFVLTSKYSFILMVFINLPIYLNTKYLLTLWLGNSVPTFTVEFVQLTLIWLTISMLSQPCMYVVQASGDLKLYQSSDLFFCGLIFLFSFVLLYKGYPCYYIYYISIVFEIVLLSIRIVLATKKINMRLKDYFYRVIIRVLVVSVPVYVINTYLKNYVKETLLSLLLWYAISGTVMVAMLYLCGMESTERKVLTNYINSKWKK